MTDEKTLKIVQKIFLAVFGSSNPYSLDEILKLFAFDVHLPKEVHDSITGVATWADSVSSGKFITNENMALKDKREGWMVPKREIHSLTDIISLWDAINFTTTERVYDSIDVVQSDTIYRCQNVYRSTGCSDSTNLIFCDSCTNCEYLLASQRSGTCSFCIRTDDSKDCSNCYSVICSNKVCNSFFIQDCFDLDECMFCAHIASKRFCIANMQFEEEEYYEIKKVVVSWILNSQ